MGGTFKASGFQVHGRGLGSSALRGDVYAISNIEENRSTLLAELWYEQVVANGVTVRAGQIFADLEFMTSDYGGLFVDSTIGQSAFATTSLPNGGPIYPRAALGVRVKAQVASDWTVLAGAFNGDPTGPDRADWRPGIPNGTALRLGDGVFAIAEVQYGLNRGDGAAGLPGTYKLDGWYNSRRFNDRTRGSDGLPLADSLGNGQAASRRGNWSVYAVADQLVWREAGTTDQGVGVFASATCSTFTWTRAFRIRACCPGGKTTPSVSASPIRGSATAVAGTTSGQDFRQFAATRHCSN